MSGRLITSAKAVAPSRFLSLTPSFPTTTSSMRTISSDPADDAY